MTTGITFDFPFIFMLLIGFEEVLVGYFPLSKPASRTGQRMLLLGKVFAAKWTAIFLFSPLQKTLDVEEVLTFKLQERLLGAADATRLSY